MRRVLIAGSRSISAPVRRVLDEILNDKASFYCETLVIHGGAHGPDRIGGLWALAQGWPSIVFEPAWEHFGKRAGPIRNGWMIEHGKPTEAIVFWDRASRGTQDMLRRLRDADVPTRVFDPDGMEITESVARDFVSSRSVGR